MLTDLLNILTTIYVYNYYNAISAEFLLKNDVLKIRRLRNIRLIMCVILAYHFMASDFLLNMWFRFQEVFIRSKIFIEHVTVLGSGTNCQAKWKSLPSGSLHSYIKLIEQCLLQESWKNASSGKNGMMFPIIDIFVSWHCKLY